MMSVILLKRSRTGAERGSRVSQIILNGLCERVRATEHASRDPLRVFERRHGVAEILERGAGVLVECHRVKRPQLECGSIILPVNASCHGNTFAQE
jgi:hypothetical protein